MRVCLVNPPFVYTPEEQASNQPVRLDSGQNTFPIGLAILASVLRQAGHFISSVEMPYLTEGEAVSRIVAQAPDVVAFSCWTGTHRLLLRVAERVKEILPRIKIVFGAHHATLFARQILENYPFVDAAVLGECEQTLPHLLDCWDGGTDPSLPGIAFRRTTVVQITGSPLRIQNLEAQPRPAYDLFHLAKDTGTERRYGARAHLGKDRRTVVLAARGCPFQCTFCVDGKFYTQTITRDPVSVVDEIEFLNRELNVGLFEFNDMTFTLSPKRIQQLCDEILRRGIEVSWQAMTRVNAISADMLKLMKAAGCFSVSFGVETGSDRLLKELKKKITRQEIEDAFEAAHQAGLTTAMLLMIGNPGENQQSVQDTIDLIYAARPAQIDPNIFQVYPGSATYAKLKAEGWITDDYWLSHDTPPYYTGEHSLRQLMLWQRTIQIHHAHYVRDYLSVRRMLEHLIHRFKVRHLGRLLNPL